MVTSKLFTCETRNWKNLHYNLIVRALKLLALICILKYCTWRIEYLNLKEFKKTKSAETKTSIWPLPMCLSSLNRPHNFHVQGALSVPERKKTFLSPEKGKLKAKKSVQSLLHYYLPSYFFPPQFYWYIIGIWYSVILRCTTRWFDVCR